MYCEELLNLPPSREHGVRGVQLYGIVKSCFSPKRTAGTDYQTTVAVFDQTCERTVDVKIFHRDRTQLPTVRRVGDIIRIEGIWTNVFYIQGQEQLGYNVKPGHGGFVALYNHTSNEGEPYFASSRSDHWKESAADARLNDLIQFRKDPEIPSRLAADDGSDNFRRNISQIDPSMSSCDLVCKVLHVEDFSAGPDRKTVFFVWDSADAKPQAWGYEPPPLSGRARRREPRRPEA